MTLSLKNFALLALGSLLVGSATGSQLPAVAMVSTEKLTQAIEQAKVLQPGISFRLTTAEGALFISTYRNTKADEKDCKIEAILLTKTAMDVSSEISRVTVDFNSIAGSGKILRVNVTAGDVKAYGGGQVSQDELLRSLKVDMLDTSASARVAQYVDSSMPPVPLNIATVQTANELKITASLAGWASERDTKYEALQLAIRSTPLLKEGVQGIRVIFTDPENKANVREITFKVSDIDVLSSKVSAALKPISITNGGTEKALETPKDKDKAADNETHEKPASTKH